MQNHPYIWLFLTAFVVQVTFLGYLSKNLHRSKVTLWLFLAASDLAIGTFAQINVFFNLAPAQFGLWVRVSGLIVLVMPLLFIFILSFVRKTSWLLSPYTYLLTFGPALVVLYRLWNTTSVVNQSYSAASLTPWGYSQQYTPGWDQAYYAVYSIAGLILLVQYYLKIKQPVKRSEVKLIVLALVLASPTFIIQNIVDDVMHASRFFPSYLLLFTCTLIIIAYALKRYGASVFNPEGLVGSVGPVLPGALLILDHAGIIQYANEGSTALTGFTPQQLIGSDLSKLFPDAQIPQAFQTQLLDALGPGGRIDMEDLTLQSSNGRPVPVNISAAQVAADDGEVNTMLVATSIARLNEARRQLAQEKAGVERKVLERTHQLDEARAQLATSLSSLPFGFAAINPQGQIVFSNSALGRLLNRTIPSDPAKSKAILAQVQDDYHAAIDILACVKDAQAKKRSIEKNIEFGPKFFRFLFVPILGQESGAVLGSVIIMEDVTEKRATERSRDEFFSIASHELRTPLTAIRGNSEMALKYYAKELSDPNLKEIITDVHGASIRLINIVNDFLDTSRLEMGKFVFNSSGFSILQLIRDTLREYEVTGSRKQLTISVDTLEGADPLVFADRDRTRQILVNLLGNAIKFTKQGGVTFRVEPGDKMVKVLIRDTGQGIPLEMQHLLFHKFQQASEDILTRDNTQSTGLGLYISKLIIEGMHGRMYLVNSEVRKGTTFAIELPRAEKPSS